MSSSTEELRRRELLTLRAENAELRAEIERLKKDHAEYRDTQSLGTGQIMRENARLKNDIMRLVEGIEVRKVGEQWPAVGDLARQLRRKYE